MRRFVPAAVVAVATCASASFGQALSEGFDWLPTTQNNGSFTQSITLESGTWIGTSTSGQIYRPASGAWNSTTPQAGTGVAYFDVSPGAVTSLMSPVLSLQNGWTISFWSKMNYSGSPERLRLLMSTAGASTSSASFATVLLDVGWSSSNPAPFDNTWRQFTATISGLSGPVSGRFAFEYTSPQGNGIYLDTVSYSVAPTPGALALLGVAGLAGSRRRRA